MRDWMLALVAVVAIGVEIAVFRHASRSTDREPTPDLGWLAPKPTIEIIASCVSPTGSRIALWGDDGIARVVDAGTARCERTIVVGAAQGQSMCFSPDGRRLLTGMWTWEMSAFGADAGGRTTWNLFELVGDPVRHPVESTDRVGSMRDARFNRSGSLAFVHSKGASVEIVDPATGRCVRVLSDVGEEILCADWLDDDRLLTGGARGTISLWTLSPLPTRISLRRGFARVDRIEASPDSRLCFVGGSNGRTACQVILRSPDLDECSRSTWSSGFEDDGYLNAAWTPRSDRVVATTGTWFTVSVHDADGRPAWEQDFGHGDEAPLVPKIDRGGQFVSLSRWRYAHGRVYRVSTGELVYEARSALPLCDSMDWTADGRWLVLAGKYTATLVSVPTFTPSHHIVLTDDGCERVEASCDG